MSRCGWRSGLERALRLLGILIAAGAVSGTVIGAPRPNVVLLIADDLGYGELSCQNPATDAPTPHIDRLADSGVRFTQGYVTAPFCAASRAGLMTGRYQTRFGFEFNPIGAENEDPQIGLPRGEKTLADRLRDETGYTTALIGKWHLGGTAAYHPMRRGFDEFFGFLHEGHSYGPPPYRGLVTWLRRRVLPDGGRGRWRSADGSLVYSTHMGHNEPDYDADNPILRNGQPVEEDSYLTEALTREAVDFIGRCGSERPFFLCVAYNAVHSPMQSRAADTERFSGIEDIHRRIFAGMLASLDDSVGRIVGRLVSLGLRERTLVFFLSDNGGPTRELTSSNAPLRGEKGQLYEGGIRVPFVLSMPGTLPAGAVESRPVLSLDICATALAACGLHEEPERPSDGVDLRAFVGGDAGAARPHETLYWRVGERVAFRQGDWKIVRHGGRADWELYDLSRDPSETRNLAKEEPARLERIAEAWGTWNREMSAPLWRRGR